MNVAQIVLLVGGIGFIGVEAYLDAAEYNKQLNYYVIGLILIFLGVCMA